VSKDCASVCDGCMTCFIFQVSMGTADVIMILTAEPPDTFHPCANYLCDNFDEYYVVLYGYYLQVFNYNLCAFHKHVSL
jgi:hypothetical protein